MGDELAENSFQKALPVTLPAEGNLFVVVPCVPLPLFTLGELVSETEGKKKMQNEWQRKGHRGGSLENQRGTRDGSPLSLDMVIALALASISSLPKANLKSPSMEKTCARK